MDSYSDYSKKRITIKKAEQRPTKWIQQNKNADYKLNCLIKCSCISLYIFMRDKKCHFVTHREKINW